MTRYGTAMDGTFGALVSITPPAALLALTSAGTPGGGLAGARVPALWIPRQEPKCQDAR